MKSSSIVLNVVVVVVLTLACCATQRRTRKGRAPRLRIFYSLTPPRIYDDDSGAFPLFVLVRSQRSFFFFFFFFYTHQHTYNASYLGAILITVRVKTYSSIYGRYRKAYQRLSPLLYTRTFSPLFSDDDNDGGGGGGGGFRNRSNRQKNSSFYAVYVPTTHFFALLTIFPSTRFQPTTRARDEAFLQLASLHVFNDARFLSVLSPWLTTSLWISMQARVPKWNYVMRHRYNSKARSNCGQSVPSPHKKIEIAMKKGRDHKI